MNVAQKIYSGLYDNDTQLRGQFVIPKLVLHMAYKYM